LAAAIEYIMVTQAVAQLEEVFRAHQACVLKAAYRITGSMADAEDVSQSVFLRLARGTVDPGNISNLQSYLHRSAVNAALDLIRSKGHREVVPVETAVELQSNSSLSPERALATLEIKNWLRRELASLNSRAAEMFALRYLEGLDNPEIARTMNTSQAVVAVTLHRTRARLKQRLRGFMKGAS
jgi:RNA polymerase sigma-70 factor, ECF subfamily